MSIEKSSIPMNCKYTNPRISYDGKYWFISVGLEKENQIVELTNESIGIDVGIKDLAICSNGMTFKNINKTRVVKKEYVKTKNISKLEKQVRLLHRKLTNIRVNHLHQATNKIVKTTCSECGNVKAILSLSERSYD